MCSHILNEARVIAVPGRTPLVLPVLNRPSHTPKQSTHAWISSLGLMAPVSACSMPSGPPPLPAPLPAWVLGNAVSLSLLAHHFGPLLLPVASSEDSYFLPSPSLITTVYPLSEKLFHHQRISVAFAGSLSCYTANPRGTTILGTTNFFQIQRHCDQIVSLRQICCCPHPSTSSEMLLG